jgi:hypothetical protein
MNPTLPLLLLLVTCVTSLGFVSLQRVAGFKSLTLQARQPSLDQNDVVLEIITRREVSVSKATLEREEQHVVAAFDSMYDDDKEEFALKVVDSPALKILGFLLNPSTMVLALYLSSIGWSKVLWLQKIFSFFGKGTLVKKPGQKEEPSVEDLPFQTFECEVCKMEMRPARGRAEVIFGRPRFRCSRCGSKASAYFDVDDMDDPRAVARLERIEEEKNAVFDDDDDDDDEYDDDDEEE